MTFRTALHFAGNVTTVLVAGTLLGFVGINLILGCKTWDQSLWSEAHSCFALSDYTAGILNLIAQ